MSKAFKCDRCENLFDFYKEEAKGKRPVSDLSIHKSYGVGQDELDLCLQCEKELVDWFNCKKPSDK